MIDPQPDKHTRSNCPQPKPILLNNQAPNTKLLTKLIHHTEDSFTEVEVEESESFDEEEDAELSSDEDYHEDPGLGEEYI